eukprot:8342992-Pyramimonas_sp.AAC.1
MGRETCEGRAGIVVVGACGRWRLRPCGAPSGATQRGGVCADIECGGRMWAVSLVGRGPMVGLPVRPRDATCEGRAEFLRGGRMRAVALRSWAKALGPWVGLPMWPRSV